MAAATAAITSASATASADDDGCRMDSDCKGDRVCDLHVCRSPSAPSQAITPVQAPSEVGLVMVHIDSNDPHVTLARVAANAIAYGSRNSVATATGYDVMCTAPCDIGVAPNQSYVFQHVSGFGARTDEFVIPARASEITYTVTTRSQNAYGIGAGSMILGFTGDLLGGVFAGVGAGVGNSGFETGGLVTLAVTVPLTIFGLYEMAHNGTTVRSSLDNEARVHAKAKSGFVATASGVGWTW